MAEARGGSKAGAQLARGKEIPDQAQILASSRLPGRGHPPMFRFTDFFLKFRD